MRTLGAIASLVLLLAGASSATRAQDIVPGVKAELVRLDVVVTDAKGKLVRDLTRDDFVLLEDGKAQRVANFVVAGKTAPAPAAKTSAPASTPPGGSPAAPVEEVRGPGRGIVIVVDDLHIAVGNIEFTKQALRRFVDEFTLADDNIALVTTSAGAVVQQLTPDRAALKEGINRLSAKEAAVAAARNTQMTPGEAEQILRGDRSARQLAASTMISEPGSIFDTNSPRAALEGPAGTLPAGSGAAGASIDPGSKERVAEREAERQARGVLAEALRFSVATLGATEDVLRSLAPLPGRKLCLLASDGFLVGAGTSEERRRDLQRIVDAATRSGAVVYTLDTRGLVSTGGDAGVAGTGVPPGLQARVDRQTEQIQRTTLESLAKDTGGFLVRGTNDLAAGLGRMLEDNETYYLLSYEPANPKRDGRFRKIEVKVSSRPGMTIRTRTGYFAPDDKKRAAADATPPPRLLADVTASRGLGEAEARGVLEAPVPPDGIPVRVAADYVDLPPGGPQAVVRAHVDLTGIRWQKVEDRQEAAIELVGGVFDADGKPVGAPFGKRAEMSLTPAEFKRATEEGLRYQQQVVLGPGRYQVRVVAREIKGAPLGGTEEWVDIPDLATKKLTLSSVFLSSSAAETGPGGTSTRETIRDAQTLRRFKRSETLYFQLYVYNPVLDEKGASDVVLQAQVRSGTNAIAASKPQPVTFRQKDAVPVPETNAIPLEALTPGTYDLRIVVVDRKANVTTFRQVDFTVE